MLDGNLLWKKEGCCRNITSNIFTYYITKGTSAVDLYDPWKGPEIPFTVSGNIIHVTQIWCEFDRESPLICGNKMPTTCNRWFLYCGSDCLFNMFWAPLCPSLGAQEYYTGGCCLWYLVLWFSSCRCGVKLWVVCPVCGMLLYWPESFLPVWHI